MTTHYSHPINTIQGVHQLIRITNGCSCQFLSK